MMKRRRKSGLECNLGFVYHLLALTRECNGVLVPARTNVGLG